MINHSIAMLGIMETLGGRTARAQELNDDLAYHAMEQALDPRPGLLTRMVAGLARALSPRDAVLVGYGISGHMARDIGVDRIHVVTEVAGARPGQPARPVALGGRLAINF